MSTLTNVRKRIHITKKIRTPFQGTLRDFIPGSSSFLIMLLAVPPGPHLDGETLRIVVDDCVRTEHTLSWLMQFWDINAQRAQRGSTSDVLQQAYDVATIVCRRSIARWDEYTTPEATTELRAIANAMKEVGEAAAKLQAICGMRLARAVVLCHQGFEVITSGGSEVDCHIGGLAEFDT